MDLDSPQNYLVVFGDAFPTLWRLQFSAYSKIKSHIYALKCLCGNFCLFNAKRGQFLIKNCMDFTSTEYAKSFFLNLENCSGDPPEPRPTGGRPSVARWRFALDTVSLQICSTS